MKVYGKGSFQPCVGSVTVSYISLLQNNALTSASVRGYVNPRRIKALYEKGPDAIGAWHPPGYWTMQFRESGMLMYHACDELKVSADKCFGQLVVACITYAKILSRMTCSTNVGKTHCTVDTNSCPTAQ